jgi:hypothetical protein
MATIRTILAAHPAGRTVIRKLSTLYTQTEAYRMSETGTLTTAQAAAADQAATLAEELAVLLEEESDGNERKAGDLRNLATQLVNFRRVVDIAGVRALWTRTRTDVEPEMGRLAEDLEAEGRDLIRRIADLIAVYTGDARGAAGGGGGGSV